VNEFEFTRKVYNEIAGDYHNKRLDRQKGAWNNYLEAPAMAIILKSLVAAKNVLDLGCGTGILTREIVDWGGIARGVDISEKMIEIARSNLPDIEFEIANAVKLPYGDNEFDIVVSSLVMHYFNDLLSPFKEVSRVLNAAGHFVFSIHHPMQESFKLDKSSKDGKPLLQPYFNENSYYWRMCGKKLLSFHHTYENIVSCLREAGFVVKNLVECRPDASLKDTFEDFEFTSNYPTFCVFQACLTD